MVTKLEFSKYFETIEALNIRANLKNNQNVGKAMKRYLQMPYTEYDLSILN